MKALAKFKGGISKARHAGRSIAKLPAKENMGSVGHQLIEYGTHAALLLASKNTDGVGPIPVKPDQLALICGGLLMAFGKGKQRKLGASFARGAGHALISRWSATETINLSDFTSPRRAPVSGPDDDM